MTYACTANLSCTHAVRRLVVVALAAVLVAATAAIAVWPHGLAAPLRQVPVATTRLPVAALAPVSRALGQDDPSYRAQRSAGALIAVNAAQRLRAQFERGTVVVSTGGLSLGLRLRAYGYGAADQQLAAVAPRVAADRVVYGHTGVTEWYANGPLGLEQGFTVSATPAGPKAGALTLAMAMSGDMRARLSRGGDGVVFTGAGGSLAYSGLVATDARGRDLRAWIEVRGSELLLRIAAAGAAYPIRIDPLIQQATLTAADGAEFDELGTSVAISGPTIVVGAPSATIGSNFDQGAAYVFVRPGSTWADATQAAKLTASDAASGDRFASSVAISGNTIVVGAPDAAVAGNFDQGAAYVFVRPGSTWADETQTAKLTTSDAASFDLVGTSVAIAGNTIVAGAPGAAVGGGDPGQGATDVFVKPASGWADESQTATLTASDGVPEDTLGQSVAIDGDTIVAGAPAPPVTFTPHHGAAYVFVEPRSGWADATQTAKLTASDGAEGDNYGFAIAVSGSTIVVGAPDANILPFNFGDGAAYVFVEPRSGWADATQTAKLTHSDGGNATVFGISVGISGDTVVAGAGLATVGANFDQGAAYVFVRPGSGWADATQTAKLTAADGAAGDQFGTAVAISGNTAAVGAPGATASGNFLQGAA